jgi:hypothetical protein
MTGRARRIHYPDCGDRWSESNDLRHRFSSEGLLPVSAGALLPVIQLQVRIPSGGSEYFSDSYCETGTASHKPEMDERVLPFT